jgi:hypothetical protein
MPEETHDHDPSGAHQQELKQDTSTRRAAVPRGLRAYMWMYAVLGVGGSALAGIGFADADELWGSLVLALIGFSFVLQWLQWLRAQWRGLIPDDLSYKAVKARGVLVEYHENRLAILAAFGEAILIPLAAFAAAERAPGNDVLGGFIAALLVTGIVLAADRHVVSRGASSQRPG